MQKKIYVRSALALVAAGATVVGMTACGNSKDDKKESVTSVVPSPAATSTVSTTSIASEAPTSSETPTETTTLTESSSAAQEVQPGEPAGAPAGSAAGPAGEQGLQPIQPAQGPVQPVSGGRPANAEEVDGITAMLRRPEQQTTMRGYMDNMVNSMCTELIESNGGAEAFRLNEFPDFQLKDLPEYQATRTTVTGVDNVMVNGADASGNVTTAKANGESETMTMRFRNEGGAWKLCG